jgi:class 3 adenylate cyclase
VTAQGVPLRLGVWTLHIALPALGLWVLLAAPETDLEWEHHQAHFWLVLLTAAISLALAVRVAIDARVRGDARLYLAALAFSAAAGFLGLHALATPDILLETGNAGFVLAVPVGLMLAALIAAASAIEFSPARARAVVRAHIYLRGVLVLFLIAWAAFSLLELPPLDHTIVAEEARGELLAVAVVGSVFYVLASFGYYRVFRRRPSALLLSVITSFFLLGEAMFATALGRNWHASWWLWHLLMTASFAFVAYSALVQFKREGSANNLFRSIALEETVQDIRAEYSDALQSLTDSIAQQRTGDDTEHATAEARSVARRFGLSEGQTEVLEEAAGALASEREQLERLAALVQLGGESSVIRADDELLDRAAAVAGPAFGRDRLRVALVHDGELRYRDAPASEVAGVTGEAARTGEPVERDFAHGATLAVPLEIKGRVAGVLEVDRPGGEFADRDRWTVRSLASQLSIAVENARLYAQIEGLFRRYLSPDVATSLIADPDQAALGGQVVDITALFADLRGFTSLTERSQPEHVVTILNACFGASAPCILGEGGTITQFQGDALVALFNAPARQPDHAVRAARASLCLQRAIEKIPSAEDLKFRVGIATGPALVGNIGSAEVRSFTAIGDPVNLAARLQTEAEPGQVVVDTPTRTALGATATIRPLGALTIKGKAEPVEAFVLEALA